MISISGSFRATFRKQIKKFCYDHDLEIKYMSYLDNYNNYIISGEAINVDKLLKFSEKLEQEYKNKNFWHKFFYS